MIVTLTLQEEHAHLILSSLRNTIRASDDATILDNASKALPIAILITAAIAEAKATEEAVKKAVDAKADRDPE